MDGENVPLIGAHGYCSQEMVNLLLTGRAVSNTFDGHITLSESGISRASDENDTIGLFYIVHESCVPMHKIIITLKIRLLNFLHLPFSNIRKMRQR